MSFNGNVCLLTNVIGQYSGVQVNEDDRIIDPGFWKKMSGSMKVFWSKIRFLK
jgi:hypothetical protein